MSWPCALRSSTLWERGSGAASELPLAEGSASDSLSTSELSESDPEMLETSPEGERKRSRANINQLKTSQVAPRCSPQPQKYPIQHPTYHKGAVGWGGKCLGVWIPRCAQAGLGQKTPFPP